MTEGRVIDGVSGVVNSLQITEHDLYVILPRKIHKIPIADPTNRSIITYPDSFKFIQYFKGEWFGLNNVNFMYKLGKSDYNSDDLIEKSFTKTDVHTFKNLVATDNYLVGVYNDPRSQGISIFYYMQDDFFNNQEKKPQENDKFSFKQLDYQIADADKLKYFYEWNGKIMTFGQNISILLGVPPTLNPQKDQFSDIKKPELSTRLILSEVKP